MQQRPLPFKDYFLKVGAKLPFFIDWEDALSVRWLGSGRFAVAGVIVRPSQATGFQYLCSTPGYTGDDEPAWSASAPVSDGSVVWTPEPVTTASLVSTIASSSWVVPIASGIGISGGALNGLVASIVADATSAIAPGDYDLVNTITLADNTNRPGTWRLKVR